MKKADFRNFNYFYSQCSETVFRVAPPSKRVQLDQTSFVCTYLGNK